MQGYNHIVQELLLSSGPVHQLVDSHSEAVTALSRLLEDPELAGENLVAQGNLGNIKPEPSCELQLLLVAVVHEAHDDVTLVDCLEVFILDVELAVSETVQALEGEILQLPGVPGLVEQREVNILHESRHRRVVWHPAAGRAAVGPIVETQEVEDLLLHHLLLQQAEAAVQHRLLVPIVEIISGYVGPH